MIPPRLLAVLPPLLAVCALTGCEVVDTVDDYFSNVVCEGLFLGLEDPAAAAQLGFTDLEGVGASTFLARARSLSSVEANVFDDAEAVTVRGASFGTATLESQGSGAYQVTTSEVNTLDYVVGERVSLVVSDAGKSFSTSVVLPASAALVDVAAHPANTALVLDLSGQGFDNEIAVVIDAGGTVTWDNRPEDVGDYLDWIGNSGEVTTVEIPASAFPDSGAAYAVGVAGVHKALDRDFDEFNPAVSNFAAGSMAVIGVVTAP